MTEKKNEKFTVTTFFVFYKKGDHYGKKVKKATFFSISKPTFVFWTFINVQNRFSNPKPGK